MVNKDLSGMLFPGAVAVVGVSDDPSKIGRVIYDNIVNSGFREHLYPINPRLRSINKHMVYKSVLDVPGKIDTAIIAIPANLVNEVVAECGQKGVKNVVIISAGFGETGEQGFLLERKLQEIIKKFQLNVLGPNCLGYISVPAKFNASFALPGYAKGSIAFASQSGAMGTAFMDWAKQNNIGIRYFFSLGNKTDIDENDFLHTVAQDPKVKSVMLYLEDFVDGRRFFELAKSLSHRLPIIVLKPGISSAAQKAMSSHTGSIAQDNEIIRRALAQAGCITVETIEQLFNVVKLIEWQPPLQGNKVAVITNAGGVGIQTVDDLNKAGMSIAHFSKREQEIFKAKLPLHAGVENPIDILGDALAERYKDTLTSIVKSKDVDAMLVLLTPQMVTESQLTAKYINKIADAHKKVVVACFVGGESLTEARSFLDQEKIPHYNFPNDAAEAMALVYKYYKYRAKALKHQTLYDLKTIINPNLEPQGITRSVDYEVARKLFTKYDLPLIPSITAYDPESLLQKVANFNFPVVAKLIHPDLTHKTEFKAVHVNIKNKQELQKSLAQLNWVARKHGFSHARYEIQPMISDMLEIIIGVKNDADSYSSFLGKKYLKNKGFGHVLLFGAGGIYAEIYKDVALQLIPVSNPEIKDMVSETKIGSILAGARNKEYHLAGVLKVLQGLNKLILDNQNISSLDINPLLVTKDKVYIADLKIFV